MAYDGAFKKVRVESYLKSSFLNYYEVVSGYFVSVLVNAARW